MFTVTIMPSQMLLATQIVLCASAVWAQAPEVAPDPTLIVRKSVEIDRKNWELLKDYTFVEDEQQKEYRKDGSIDKTHSQTYDVLVLDGTPYRRKTAKDGKALDEKESRKEQEKFEKERSRRLHETADQRRKRVEEEAKDRAKGHAFVMQIPDAYNFALAGEENMDGKPVWVIDATPRPGFKPTQPHGDMLPKFKGRLWIEKEDYRWVKVEAQTIGAVSFGMALLRFRPGTTVTFNQTRLNSELWVPSHFLARLDLRVGWVKGIRVDVETNWHDYRKFTAESRIVSTQQ